MKLPTNPTRIDVIEHRSLLLRTGALIPDKKSALVLSADIEALRAVYYRVIQVHNHLGICPLCGFTMDDSDNPHEQDCVMYRLMSSNRPYTEDLPSDKEELKGPWEDGYVFPSHIPAKPGTPAVSWSRKTTHPTNREGSSSLLVDRVQLSAPDDEGNVTVQILVAQSDQERIRAMYESGGWEQEAAVSFADGNVMMVYKAPSDVAQVFIDNIRSVTGASNIQTTSE